MNLHGRHWTRRQIEERVGHLDQVGGVQKAALADGMSAGVEQIVVRTGGGLTYHVLPSRGLDISLATFGGSAISWQSPNGSVNPAFYESQGAEWLRSAVGGLLMTCGLTNVGTACEVDGQPLGVHGRAHALAARQVCASGQWVGDDYEIRITGIIEQTRIFGENLRLSRQITSLLGENRIAIRDVVENLAFAESPLMLLYHFNFGFPLLMEGTAIQFPSGRVTARDPGVTTDGIGRWEPPQAGIAERAYYHEDLSADADGTTYVTIHNPAFPMAGVPGGTCPLAVRLRWNTRQLPRVVQWKMPGQGMHVLGIEPANCHVEGQLTEHNRGTLATIAPGQSLRFDLELDLKVK